VTDQILFNPENYDDFLRDLKQRIRQAQSKAALAVNQELITLYWQIGKEITIRIKREGWGAKVTSRLAKDLKKAFPEMSGLSERNLQYMKAFAEAYPDLEFAQRKFHVDIIKLFSTKSNPQRKGSGMLKNLSSMVGVGIS